MSRTKTSLLWIGTIAAVVGAIAAVVAILPVFTVNCDVELATLGPIIRQAEFLEIPFAVLDWDEFQAACERLEELRPKCLDHKDCVYLLAVCKGAKKSDESQLEAKRLFNDLTADEAQKTVALHGLGRLHFQAGQFTAATETLISALALEPENPVVLKNLVYVILYSESSNASLEKYKAAKEYAEKAVALEPTCTIGHKYVAFIYLALSWWQAAPYHYKRALDSAEFEEGDPRMGELIAGFCGSLAVKQDRGLRLNRLDREGFDQYVAGLEKRPPTCEGLFEEQETN